MNIRFWRLKFNRRPTDAFWYFRLSAMLIVTAVAAGLVIFLYRDFYQTIVQAETVLVLKQEVALQDINMELFNKVKAVEQIKRSSVLPNPIPDPFMTVKIITPVDTPTEIK